MESTRSFSLLKDAYPSGVANLNSDQIQMMERVLAQVAEHAQAA